MTVGGGDPLDETVLRSYVTGAAHMALGWVCSEGIAVDEDGVPEDLTIRSFGILRPGTPRRSRFTSRGARRRASRSRFRRRLRRGRGRHLDRPGPAAPVAD